MHKLSTQKLLGIIFTALLFFILIELGILFPLVIKKSSSISKGMRVLKERIMATQREWALKNTYSLRKDSLREEIKKIKDSILRPREEHSLLSFLSIESKNCNIEIETMKPLSAQEPAGNKAGGFRSVPVLIEARGNFHDVTAFLEILSKNNRYIIEIKEMTIVSQKTGNAVKLLICALM